MPMVLAQVHASSASNRLLSNTLSSTGISYTTVYRYGFLALLSLLIPLVADLSQSAAFAVLYGISCALTVSLADASMSSGMLLAVLHGFTHHVWPFINESGLNPEQTVFFDMVVHLALGLWAHLVVINITCRDAPTAVRALLHLVGTVLLLGNLASVFASVMLPADNPIFVESAIFSALNSGYFAAAALTLGNRCSGWQLPKHLALWFSICFAFYYAFRASNDALAYMFVHRFFESFFMIPIWACVLVPSVAAKSTSRPNHTKSN